METKSVYVHNFTFLILKVKCVVYPALDGIAWAICIGRRACVVQSYDEQVQTKPSRKSRGWKIVLQKVSIFSSYLPTFTEKLYFVMHKLIIDDF